MPSASELHAQYPYIAPSGCFPPRGFDFPLLSLSFPLRYALDQFHLNSAGFRALDQSRIIIQLYDLQVSAIENDEDEISLLLAAYNYLVTECHKVDPIYAQEVLDDLVVLHNGQLEGEHKQALIYINTSTVSKDSYSSVFSVYTDDRTDASHSNLFELGLFTHLDHFATMSGPTSTRLFASGLFSVPQTQKYQCLSLQSYHSHNCNKRAGLCAASTPDTHS